MNVYPLFAEPIAFFKHQDILSDNAIEFINTTKTHNNQGNLVSDNYYVLNEDCFDPLKKFIKLCVDEYFKNIHCPKYDVNLEITQSWLNYSSKDQWHHKHSHANSFVSGVFYIKTNPESDKIFFSRSRVKYPLHIVSDNFNDFNSQSWWFPVETNTLILFPSYLEHYVEPITGDETRTSLAFNTFPKGYIGNEDNLTALHL